jgi:hypothetical protein
MPWEQSWHETMGRGSEQELEAYNSMAEEISRLQADVETARADGWAAAINAAASLAEQWASENRTSSARARRRGDDILAEELNGAAIEANAFAVEIRKLRERT